MHRKVQDCLKYIFPSCTEVGVESLKKKSPKVWCQESWACFIQMKSVKLRPLSTSQDWLSKQICSSQSMTSVTVTCNCNTFCIQLQHICIQLLVLQYIIFSASQGHIGLPGLRGPTGQQGPPVSVANNEVSMLIAEIAFYSAFLWCVVSYLFNICSFQRESQVDLGSKDQKEKEAQK